MTGSRETRPRFVMAEKFCCFGWDIGWKFGDTHILEARALASCVLAEVKWQTRRKTGREAILSQCSLQFTELVASEKLAAADGEGETPQRGFVDFVFGYD